MHLDCCRTDPTFKARDLDTCRESAAYWIGAWCYVYEPRAAGEDAPRVLPFDLWPVQARYLEWLDERERAQTRGLCEKARGMGITWLSVLWALHRWLFRDEYAIGFGSRKEELVDRLGDRDSILEKARWELGRLPSWMLPEGLEPRRDLGFRKLVNPANGSSITGEAGDEIGRGGRKGAYFVDESAFLEHPDKIEGSLSDNTDMRIDVSTVNGPTGPFYRLRHAGRVSVFVAPWEEHPARDAAWAVKKAEELGPVRFASEYARDYTASVSGVVILATWVRAGVGAALLWEDSSPYAPSGDIIGGLDLGETSNTLALRRGAQVLSVRQWAGGIEQALPEGIRLCEQAGAALMLYDAQGPGAKGSEILARFRATPVRVVGVNVGEPVPEDVVLADGRRACERYANLRAWLWDEVMGGRLLRTYEAAQGTYRRADECLALPDDPQLAVELSVPTRKANSAGKVLLVSKAELALAGIASPHRADALSLTFAPVPDLLAPAGVRASPVPKCLR